MAEVSYDDIFLNLTSKLDTKGIDSAVKALQGLQGIKGFSGLKQASQDIKGFCDALDGISNKRMKTITNLANAIKGLGGASKAMKAVATTAQASNPLNDTSMATAPEPKLEKPDLPVEKADAFKDAISKVNAKWKEFLAGIKEAESPLQKLVNKFNKFLQYRAMRAVWSAMVNGIKEGFSNLEAWDRRNGMLTGFAESMDRARESLLVLKNSLAVVGAPFLEGLISMLQQVASWAMASANAISRLFAILGGQSRYRAVQWAEYTANAVKATTGAVKDAGKEFKKQLMAFDEINNITEQKGSSGGGGYGNSGYFNYDDMFDWKEVGEISDAEKKLKAIIEWIKKIASELKPIFDRLTLVGNAISTIWQTTKNVVTAVATWLSHLLNPAWQGFKDIISGIVNVFISLADLVSSAYEAIGNIIIAIGNLLDVIGIWSGIGKELEGDFRVIGNILDDVAFKIELVATALHMLALQADYVAHYFDLLNQFLHGKMSWNEFKQSVQDAKHQLEVDMGTAVTNLKDKLDKMFDKKYRLSANSSEVESAEKAVKKMGDSADTIFAKKHALNFDTTSTENAKARIGEVSGAVDTLSTKIKDLTKKPHLITINVSENVTKTVNTYENIISSGKSGKFAEGGFPTTGQLFIAREAGAEMVGQIGGHTAVANNQDIVASVSQGVASAVASVLGNGRSNVTVTLEGDAKGLFKVVQKEGRAYSARTGQPALA